MTRLLRIRFLLAGLFTATLLHAGLARGDEERTTWHEVRTEHFVVRTDAERERAVRLATELEKYRFTISYLSGLDTRDVPSVPVRVYAYRSSDDYIDATDAFGTAGFYLPRQSGPVSVLSLEDGEEEWQLAGKRVLFHEYTHHILHQYSPLDYPRWYDEGFAEYMATMEFDDGHAVIGKPALHRVPHLKRVKDWVRTFELVDSRGRYMGHIGTSLMRDSRRGKSGQPLQYAQGWLMVHYLHSSPRLQQAIPGYLQEINRADVDDEKAFRDAFGMSYKDFDKAVLRYWREKEFAMGRVDIAARLPEIEPRVREMPPVEADAIDYEVAVATGRAGSVSAERAAEAFDRCLEAGIRPVQMHLSLVGLAFADEDWSTARARVERLMEASPGSSEALTASVQLERMRHADELAGDQALALRKTVTQAILADPTHVPALVQFADLTFEHDLEVDHNVASVIESIRFLAPDLAIGKVLEARLLAGQGEVDAALTLLDEMIKWSSSSGQAARYRELREELAEQS